MSPTTNWISLSAGIMLYPMEGYATGLFGSPTSGTSGAGNREDCKLRQVVSPWTVKRQTRCDALNPHISGVSTDVLVFSECGAPLIHHYRVFGGGGRTSPCVGAISVNSGHS